MLAAGEKVVGTFEVHVDPRAANPMTITPVGLTDRTTVSGGLGTKAEAVSVLGSATLSGPGTWNATTKILSATIGITNNDTGNYWDEPYLSISSISPAGTGHTVTVQAVNYGTLRNATGSIITSGGAGSKYGLADIPRSGVAHNYALQKIAFYDPDGVAFSFTVDVVANLNGLSTTGILADTDDDMYNMEAYAQAAGGDCVEGSPGSTPQVTCSPTPPADSGCATDCPTSTGSTCPSGTSTSDCCVNTAGSGDPTSNTCPSGSTTCTCDQTYQQGGNTTVTF
ncbi:MAG: hypothetical protein ACXVEE_18035, partial [Polyangiales bacterium]